MAEEKSIDLNKSLKEYLSRNDASAESKSLLKSVSIDSWFGNSSDSSSSSTVKESKSSDSWLSSSSEESGWCPALSKTQRIVGFAILLSLGVFFLVLSTMYIPVLLLRARKFSLLYSMGSLCVIGSFAMLWGPVNHFKHLCSLERLPFTIVYFGTMALTLYSAMWVRSSIVTAVCATLQFIALIWYVVSYIPGGAAGLKFFTKICTSWTTKTVGKSLPV